MLHLQLGKKYNIDEIISELPKNLLVVSTYVIDVDCNGPYEVFSNFTIYDKNINVFDIYLSKKIYGYKYNDIKKICEIYEHECGQEMLLKIIIYNIDKNKIKDTDTYNFVEKEKLTCATCKLCA